MDSLPSVCTVQAEYSFKGSNNDELCFKKGDIITVTQKEDGGWWEGTLVDKTGWFPSNYVKEYKVPLTLADTIRAPEEIQAFRSVVYNDLLDSERAHVAEVRGMVENFLEPLEASQILTTDEYAQLMCNFMEIVECHEDLYVNLEECTNDRVGKIFLAKAPIMKKVHQQYCALHPRAIVIVDKYKDELNTFMERQGAAKPGLLVLTTGLSKPFRRLDKYSAILQELERHMEICHPDRGDTQRSIAVYKDLAASCSATRRQKELELQILTGPVRGWQGQELSSLGEIIHMGSVAVGPDHRDRYFVLFPQTLLILSVSQRMSAFKYEGQLPISGITVTRLDDSDQMKNAFEISGPMIERIVAVCQGPSDANKWVDFLTNNGGTLTKTVDILQRQRSDFELRRNASTASAAVSIPQPPPHMSPPVLGSSHPTRNTMSMQQVSQHKRSLSFNHHLSYNQVQQQQQVQARNQLLESHKLNRDPKSVLGPGAKSGPKKANWNITNLRPAPPLRPNLLTTTSASANTSAQQLQSSPASLASSKKPQPTYEEDALVLRVIEAYCAAYQNTSRNTIHSALQPWTPCLPIRGGKLKSSKPFSSSNPQLPFMCSSISSYLNINNNHAQPQTNSTSSLNSSHIWREASPNNFNLYGTSVSSLNTAYRSRYSIGGCVGSGNDRSGGGGCKEWRSASEEKPQSMVINNNNNNNNSNNVGMYQPAASKPGSNYDNIYMNVTTPLLGTRKNKQGKIWKISTISTRASPSHQYQPANRLVDETRSASPSPGPSSGPTRGSLYDRRLNRSFETSSQGQFSLGGCINKNSKTSPMRRSTPVLMRDGDDMQKEDVNGSNRIDSEDKTPTLRQIWLSVRQLQQDMVQVKTQISEERALRSHLQQLLISHLDASGNNKC